MEFLGNFNYFESNFPVLPPPPLNTSKSIASSIGTHFIRICRILGSNETAGCTADRRVNAVQLAVDQSSFLRT